MKVKAVTVLSNATAERSTVEWEDLKLYHKKNISQGDQKVYYQKQPPELFCKKRFS